MEITSGIIHSAQKVIVYGPEGIGKTTFASKFPDPVFIDTEGSTKKLDVKRFPSPTSWTMLMEEVRYVADHPECCRTLVVDTLDWAERMAAKHVCSLNHWSSIEDPGYGAGYRHVYEAFGELLNTLSDVVEKGVNIVCTAHAAMRKFEQPDEMGSYDRWEMKLQISQKCNISQMVKEWADTVLFANFKTAVITQSDKKGKITKAKAQGAGIRTMYTSHHSCWDAKNRDGLPDELPFEYSSIASIIPGSGAAKAEEAAGFCETPARVPIASAEKPEKEELPTLPQPAGTDDQPEEAREDPKEAEAKTDNPFGRAVYKEPDARIPKALRDLMIQNKVVEWDIQNAVSGRGYFPPDIEVWDYPPDFIDGVLVGAWKDVYKMITDSWENQDIPFN